MSTKEEVSPTRKTDKRICKKDFPDSKVLITEEDSEEDIEEMSYSLADLKVGEEGNANDSNLNTNMEEVGVDEELNQLEVDIVEKENFVTVDASEEVDPLETGEDHEVFEKCARTKKLEKLSER